MSGTVPIRIDTADGDLMIHYDQQVCSRCILPAAFPDVTFDVNGLCSYCRDESERIVVAEAAIHEAVETALAAAAPDRDYDCLVLYSGGKDSSLALSIASRRLGLRVLAFTLDNGFLSAGAADNMRRVLDGLGVDHVLFRPPGTVMRPLYRISMELRFGADTTKYSTAGCGSCISVVLATGLRLATAHRIPLLVGGWTPGQFTTSALCSVSFLEDVVRRHFDPLTAASPSLADQLAAWRRSVDATRPAGLLNPLYASRYSEGDTLAALSDLGWKTPPDTDSCSTNCRLNGLLIVDHLRRHGYHPYVYELAHHVRLGAITREEALDKVSRVGVDPDRLNGVANELGIGSLPSPVRPGAADVR